MSMRVTADDLYVAEDALIHQADTCAEMDDETAAALRRVAAWLNRERYRRYRAATYRSISH